MISCPLSVAVRADAGPCQGYGHVHRTLSVMDELCRKVNARIRYLMLPASDPKLVREAGHQVASVPTHVIEFILQGIAPMAGPLILDSYDLTQDDLVRLHEAGYCTILFDDSNRLGNYPVEVLINSAPDADELAYEGLETTRFCLGADYYPIRGEFRNQKRHPVDKDKVLNLVVTFGGSDPDDQTARLLRLLTQCSTNWHITAILGPGYDGEAEQIAQMHADIRVQRDPENIARLLASGDLAISGAGGTALELSYLGVPALLLVLSDDQRRIASTLSKAGAAVNLGDCQNAADSVILHSVRQVASDSDRRQEMSLAGQRLVDGLGSGRIVDAILDAWKHHHNGDLVKLQGNR